MSALREAISTFASGDEEARREAVARLDVQRGAPEAAEALRFLVEAMGDTSWRVRKEAAARAADWDDRERAAEALVQALAEPDNVGRRNAAVEGLVTLGAQAVPPLVRALEPRPEHRKLLVDTLGLIGDARGGVAVAPLVDDSDANVRVAAAEALGGIAGAEAISALRHALGRRERLLQLAALEGLSRAGAHLNVDELAPLALEPTLRAASLEALGRTRDAAAAPLLAAALGDGARSTREAATRALAQLHADLGGLRLVIDEGALPPLVGALLEAAPDVRRAAARLLGLSHHRDAVRPLALALGEPELRPAATAALVMLGPVAVDELVTLAPDIEARLRADVFGILSRLGAGARSARGLLEEALADEDADAASAAAEALGSLGEKESLPGLVRALERERPVATAAAAALGALGRRFYDEVRMLVQSRGLDGPDAPYLCRVLGACGRAGDVHVLRGALGADSAALRRAAAEALGELPAAPGDNVVDEALVFALADESPEVRAAAARALGAHARGSALAPLQRAAHDPEAPVRAAAAHALGRIAELAEGEMRNSALDTVRELADLPDAVVAAPALEALGIAGEVADEGRLVLALERPDEEVVKAAARALGRRQAGERGRMALVEALADWRWDVRRAAAEALGAQGPAAHASLYARRAVEDDPLVLEAIDAALVRAVG